MSEFDFIEEYDMDELAYTHSVSVPTKEELEFYEWFLANPDARSCDIISRFKVLNKYCFIPNTPIFKLRELLTIDQNHCDEKSFQKAEAIRLFMEGEDMSHSTGICESDTQGYGRLGYYGYWEHPISQADLERAASDEDWCMRKGRVE